MTGQWSDRSAMSGRKTLSPPGPMSYLCCLALRIWTSFWRREDSDGMDMWNAPMVQSRQPLTYRLMESVGLGGPKWHGSNWQRGIAESESSRLSTLMIDVPGDLVWDLPCVQQASYLEGGPLMWMLPLYLHVNKTSDHDDDMNDNICFRRIRDQKYPIILQLILLIPNTLFFLDLYLSILKRYLQSYITSSKVTINMMFMTLFFSIYRDDILKICKWS